MSGDSAGAEALTTQLDQAETDAQAAAESFGFEECGQTGTALSTGSSTTTDALGCPGDDDPRSDDHNATGDDPGPRDPGPVDGRHLRRHLGRYVQRHRRDLGRNRRRLLRRHQPLSARPRGRSGGELAGPGAVEARVRATELEQLLVGAALGDPPVLEDDDPARPPDRRQAVGDDDRGPADEQPLEALLDPLLGPDVDVRGRLVEDQDPRLGEQRPGEGDDLPLAGRERRCRARRPRCRAPRAAPRSAARRRPSRSASMISSRDRAGPPERDVVGDRAAEQEALLRHDPEPAAERLRVELADVDPVDQDPTRAAGRRSGRRASPGSTCRRRSRRPARRSGRGGSAGRRRVSAQSCSRPGFSA